MGAQARYVEVTLREPAKEVVLRGDRPSTGRPRYPCSIP
jgi:hypothetical protein